MELGERLRNLRVEAKMSQGDVEKKTGLLRCYVSRVENGFTVPSIETLTKMAAAMDLPLYRLFHDGTVPAKVVAFRANDTKKEKDSPELEALRKKLPKMSERNRSLLLRMAAVMAKRTEKAERAAHAR